LGIAIGGPVGLAVVGVKTGIGLGLGFGTLGLVVGYKGGDLLNKKNQDLPTVQEKKNQ
jgi:hypothetical protein